MLNISWEGGAILASIVSFIGVIINIFLIRGQSKKQRTAEIITSNRVQWIQNFKEIISLYVSYIGYYYDKKIPKDIDEYLNEIAKITAKIKLHLNLNGIQDKEIINVIEKLNLSLEKFLQLTKDKYNFKNEEKRINKETIDYYMHNYNEVFGKITKKYISEKIGSQDEEEIKHKAHNILGEKPNVQELCQLYYEIIDKDLKDSVKIIKDGSNLLLLLVRIYLKAEWERVKIEAEYGNFSKNDFNAIYIRIRSGVQDEIKKFQEDMKIELDEYESKYIKKFKPLRKRFRIMTRTPIQWSRLIFSFSFIVSIWLAVLGKITSDRVSAIASILSTAWLTLELMVSNIKESRK